MLVVLVDFVMANLSLYIACKGNFQNHTDVAPFLEVKLQVVYSYVFRYF